MPDWNSLTDDDLFRMLGEELAAKQAGARLPPYEVLVRNGRDWMTSNKQSSATLYVLRQSFAHSSAMKISGRRCCSSSEML